jgi:hypothetical protein
LRCATVSHKAQPPEKGALSHAVKAYRSAVLEHLDRRWGEVSYAKDQAAAASGNNANRGRGAEMFHRVTPAKTRGC